MEKEIEEKLESFAKESEEIKNRLGATNSDKEAIKQSSYQAVKREEIISLSQRYNELSGLVALWHRYKAVRERIDEDNRIMSSGDKELVTLAKEECVELKQEMAEIEAELIEKLIVKDPNDERDVIMEIRQGAGGAEASLFAKDLFRMYSRLAERKRWRTEVLSSHPTGIGGFKEIIYNVKGNEVYKSLKYESGTHRVQRVPITESSGRLHTSTATVCVLPEASPVDIKINPQNIKFEAFRAGGHGGQNVNKVSSAVRLTHVPTGLVAICQDERSQHQNRERAMKILCARLYAQKIREGEEKIRASRKVQIGEGERAEKIRTYNYPQQRVTDHRINMSIHKLNSILDGELDELVEALEDANKKCLKREIV